MGSFSTTFYFVQQIGNEYEFRMIWTSWNVTQMIFEYARGKTLMPSAVPDELIDAATALRNAPSFIPQGSEIDKWDKTTYTTTLDLKLDRAHIMTMRLDLVNELSLSVFKEKYFIAATLFYRGYLDSFSPIPSTPPEGQAFAPPESNPDLKGDILYSPVEGWSIHEQTVTERHFTYNRTQATVRYLWIFDLTDPGSPHIVYDYDHFYGEINTYLQYDGICFNFPLISDNRGFTFIHINNEQKDEYYVDEYWPDIPDVWYPPRTGDGLEQPSAPPFPPPPVWKPDSPFDLFDFPLSFGQASSSVSPIGGFERLLSNGTPLFINGLSFGTQISE